MSADRPEMKVYAPPTEQPLVLPPTPERLRVRAILDLLRVRMIGPDEAVDRILAVFRDDPNKSIRDR